MYNVAEEGGDGSVPLSRDDEMKATLLAFQVCQECATGVVSP